MYVLKDFKIVEPRLHFMTYSINNTYTHVCREAFCPIAGQVANYFEVV